MYQQLQNSTPPQMDEDSENDGAEGDSDEEEEEDDDDCERLGASA